jgi:hypothetical protein
MGFSRYSQVECSTFKDPFSASGDVQEMRKRRKDSKVTGKVSVFIVDVYVHKLLLLPGEINSQNDPLFALNGNYAAFHCQIVQQEDGFVH